jgi:HK97 family phage prohead protease
LSGYAIRFNEKSVDLGGFFEVVAPEALDRTAAERPDLRALWQHDAAAVLGRASAGTLDYSVDRNGLRVAIATPNTQLGRDAAESVRRRDVDAMSFSFGTLVDDWQAQGDVVLRTLRDITVREVSIVSWPAYPTTSISTGRSMSSFTNRDMGTEGPAIERWNQRTPSEREANQLKVKLARLVAQGRSRCQVCEKGTGVAVRGHVITCAGCLRSGDELRRDTFRRGGRSQGGQSVQAMREKLNAVLTLDEQIADQRRQFERMRPR